MNLRSWQWDRAAPIVYPLMLLLIILGSWEASSRTGLFPPFILPAPSDIAIRSGQTFQIMAYHCLVTSGEIVAGFLLAAAVGILLAALIVYVRAFEQAMYPWLVVIQVVPKVALGPLFVIWLGVGFGPKVLVAFLLAFFPVMIATMVGLRSVSRDSNFLMISMGAGPLQRLFYLQLPNALPHIFGSLKVAVTLATVGAIVGEFIGSNEGLGYVMMSATGTLDTVLIFVALAWITVTSLIFYAAIAALEKLLVSWHSSVRSARPQAA